jgi:hypothetical protein
MFSVAMSTFIYEYGFEAFFEQPSLQDIIFTPFWGALIGEVFLLSESKIKANNNRLLGSRTLGTITIFLMNPLGYIVDGLSSLSSGLSNFGLDLEYFAKRYNAPNDLLMSDYPREYIYGFKINVFRK